jgi:hypothetical protein
MPFYPTAYDTTAGQVMGFETRKVDLAARAAMISGEPDHQTMGVRPTENHSPFFILGNSNEEREVPPFIHPYLIQKFKSRSYLVADLRIFRSRGDGWQSEREFVQGIRNMAEYAMVINRTILGLLWLEKDQVSFVRAQFSFAATVYAQLISQVVGRAYGLDLHDQSRVSAFAYYFYQLLFEEGKTLPDERKDAVASQITKMTKLPATEVYEILDKAPPLANIGDFCAALKDVASNIRLQNFNFAMLLTLVRNVWYGLHSKEILAAALEHPPTWITVVYATMVERSYKSSALYKTIESAAKRGNADEFRLNFHDLLPTRTMAIETVEEELDFKLFEA